MPETNELALTHPWFHEISRALGTNFETVSRLAIGQLLDKKGHQAMANMFGPFAPSLFDGILDQKQVQAITDCIPAQPVNSESAINYFTQLIQGVVRLYAKQSGQKAPSDELFLALKETVQSAIPAHTGTELVTTREQPQTIEVAVPSRQEELKSSDAYYGVTEAVLQSENLKIENRNSIEGVEIEAGGEQHFVPLEHLWTLIDWSPAASNGIQKEPFQNEYRQNKIAQETQDKLNAVDDKTEKRLIEEWTDFILGIRREQIRSEVSNLNQVQPRLDEERQELEQLSATELRDKVIELAAQTPLVDMAEKEEIDRAYQTASEKLQFHQVVERVLASPDYDDMVVGMTNAQKKTSRRINQNLQPETTKIDPEKPDPIPIYAELEPVVEEFYQAIYRALYQEALIAHYPASSDELVRVKTIFQQALNDVFVGLESSSTVLRGEEFDQRSALNKISLAFGMLMRKMLTGIKTYEEVEPMVNAIVNEQLKLAIEKRQLTLRSHDGNKVEVDNINSNTAKARAILAHKLVDDLLPAVVYFQAVGDSLHDQTLIQSAEVWQQHWLSALDLPTASIRDVEYDTPYSRRFRALPQARQDIAAVHQKAEKDLPEIREKREIRLKVEEARRQIDLARQKIETLLAKVEELRVEARKRLTEAQQTFVQAEKNRQDTPEKHDWRGRPTNKKEVQDAHDKWMQAEAAVKDAELNLKLVSEGRGVAGGLIERISAIREQIGRAQAEIQKLNFPKTPSLDIDFEPKKDAQGQPILDLTEREE